MDERYMMLTTHAGDHPLMRGMHRPDPKLGPDKQVKRSAISVELADVGKWVAGTMEDAKELLKVSSVKVFDAGPARS